MIYLRDTDGQPLMPSMRYGAIRRALRDNTASVIQDLPFTVQFNYLASDMRDETAQDITITQPLILAIDPGHTIGAAVIRQDGTPVFLAEFETRSHDIPALMDSRHAARRMRRQHRREKRKRRAAKAGTLFKDNSRAYQIQGHDNDNNQFKPLICKQIKPKLARFNNRTRDDKWLTPTARHLLYSHIQFIHTICDLLPISHIVLEYAQFDLQKINNPEITGKEYQQGRMLGYANVKQFVLERDHHLCQLCRKKTQTHLHVHHVLWRRDGGSDTPENLTILCHECHDLVHTSIATNQKLQETFKGISKRLVHTTLLNIILPFLYNYLEADTIPVSRTYGYITTHCRKKWGITKSHALDAYVMAINKVRVSPALGYDIFPVFKYAQFRRHKRKLISRIEDRKYYREDNGKSICVAKNRGAGRTGQSDKPGIMEYKNEHGEKAVATLRVGKKGKGKKAIIDKKKLPNFYPGDIVRYNKTRKVVKGSRNRGTRLGFIGEKEYVKSTDCQLIRRNTGIVCVGTICTDNTSNTHIGV